MRNSDTIEIPYDNSYPPSCGGQASASTQQGEAIPHEEVLKRLEGQIQRIDFIERAGMQREKDLQKKHYVVYTIDEILRITRQRGWRLCKKDGFMYLYNGAFWKPINEETLLQFFGTAAELLGVESCDSKYHAFREDLLKQFEATAFLDAPDSNRDLTLINLRNGTFEITESHQVLRSPDPNDFLRYQLLFDYDPEATSPMWAGFLDQVLPDKELQMVLQEYVGYIFLSSEHLKLEKVMLAYGNGANGKSVVVSVITALLGKENVTNYALDSITKENSYSRPCLANILLNCATEISGKLDAAIFKQLASGEPVEARHIRGVPFTMTRYAKLLFACNELPSNTEQTNGFYRRFLVVPFNVTIPSDKQDKSLSNTIISNELPGILNWALKGLRRLLVNKAFTESEAVKKQIEEFKVQSDSVLLFLQELGYEPSLDQSKALQDLYTEYKVFCHSNGFHQVSIRKIGDRIRNAGFKTVRRNEGNFVYVQRKKVCE